MPLPPLHCVPVSEVVVQDTPLQQSPSPRRGIPSPSMNKQWWVDQQVSCRTFLRDICPPPCLRLPLTSYAHALEAHLLSAVAMAVPDPHIGAVL